MTGKCPKGFRVFAQWHEGLLLGALHFDGFDPSNLFAMSFRSNPPPDIRFVLDSLSGDAIR